MTAANETYRFCVIGYDSKDEPTYLGVADTSEEAERLRSNGKTLGWSNVAVLDSGLREVVPLARVFRAIENQILNGKTYFATAQALFNLVDSDLRVFQEAATFFGMTAAGGMELAQMAIARLYDPPGRAKRAITIPSMLEQSKREAKSFQCGDEKQVNEVIDKALSTINELAPILSSIRRRRNEWLAHLDVRTVADPQELNVRAKLSVPDVERVLKASEEIFLRMERLYNGLVGGISYIGAKDYTNLLDLIRRGQAARGY
jgi:hypothetical protein